MSVTMQSMLDDLNQRLGDANNAAGVGEDTKVRWLKSGLRAMWPRVYREIVDDSSLAIVDSTYEYELPATFDETEVYRIEVQVGPALERWARVDGYLIDGLASKTLVFEQLPGIVGADLRIRAVAPLDTDSLVAASTVEMSSRYAELPVWYALGLAMQGGHEDRLDHARYATVIGRNGVDVAEIMNSSQFCFAQFELLLDRMTMPWPAG